MRRREWLRSVGLGVPALSLARHASAFPTTVADRVERLFRAPGPRPNGLQSSRDGIWVLDEETGRASLMEFASWQVKQEVQTPAQGGSGITFDGISLWISSTGNRKLIKMELETGLLQAEFDTPGTGPLKWGESGPATMVGAHGIEWNQGELLLAVQPACKIFVVKPRDGSVIRSIDAPGARPRGLAWDPDGALWCAESNYRSFFKLDPASGNILKQHMLPLTGPEVAGKLILPGDITIWQRYIYFTVPGQADIYRTPLVNRMS